MYRSGYAVKYERRLRRRVEPGSSHLSAADGECRDVMQAQVWMIMEGSGIMRGLRGGYPAQVVDRERLVRRPGNN